MNDELKLDIAIAIVVAVTAIVAGGAGFAFGSSLTTGKPPVTPAPTSESRNLGVQDVELLMLVCAKSCGDVPTREFQMSADHVLCSCHASVATKGGFGQ